MGARERTDFDRPRDGFEDFFDFLGDDQANAELFEIALKAPRREPIADARGGAGAEVRGDQRFLNVVERRSVEWSGAEAREATDQPVRGALEPAEELFVPTAHAARSSTEAATRRPSATPVTTTSMI